MEDEGSLVYCWSCGAPQVLLSEELRERLAQQIETQQSGNHIDPHGSGPAAEVPTDPTAVLWPRVMQLVALAAAVFFAFQVFAEALPAVFLLVMLWVLGAPIILLGIYCVRNPRTTITTGFGARLGLLSGLSIGTAFFMVNTLLLLVRRFVLHQGAALDTQFTDSMSQTAARMPQLVTADPAAIQQMFQMAAIPEFHAGLLLFGITMVLGLYAIYSTLAGAFAGLLRSRTRAA